MEFKLPVMLVVGGAGPSTSGQWLAYLTYSMWKFAISLWDLVSTTRQQTPTSLKWPPTDKEVFTLR